jgi:hypothetical protein
MEHGVLHVSLKNREVVACLEPRGQSDVDFDNGCNVRFYFLLLFFHSASCTLYVGTVERHKGR